MVRLIGRSRRTELEILEQIDSLRHSGGTVESSVPVFDKVVRGYWGKLGWRESEAEEEGGVSLNTPSPSCNRKNRGSHMLAIGFPGTK